ncbi:MAG: hypothetical protein JW894_04845 [Bacteroidales bacterium]|nr:hypothetical protein [Bacteroidales bacterium]
MMPPQVSSGPSAISHGSHSSRHTSQNPLKWKRSMFRWSWQGNIRHTLFSLGGPGFPGLFLSPGCPGLFLTRE